MAYWGEAMTFNHGVWNQVDVGAGHAALAKFGATAEERARRIADPRERAYMSAVEILYSGKADKRERDAQHAAVMNQLTEAYPKDDEAQLFMRWRCNSAGDGPAIRKAIGRCRSPGPSCGGAPCGRTEKEKRSNCQRSGKGRWNFTAEPFEN
jgi:hypothetical protein